MKKQKILITGGNGFIGTQVACELHECGHDVTVVDRRAKVWDTPVTVVNEDYSSFLAKNDVIYDTIVHLAAEHLVEKSVKEPALYYENNVIKMKIMLDRMVELGIKNIIFSSSGNTYGRQGQSGLLKEDVMFYDPENSYASTKVAGELMIKDYAKAYGINYVNFRYFNVAGADPLGRFGYVQRPATHVIPILCNKILNSEAFSVYGTDYPTPDGTCVRDYVHVADLAKAHSLAINHLETSGKSETFNLGGGVGTSVKDLVRFSSEIVNKDAVLNYCDRRAGDPAMLVADITKAKDILKWSPEYSIKDAISHAWAWEQKFENKGK